MNRDDRRRSGPSRRSSLVNAVLLAAPAGSRTAGPLGSYFFGPKLVRAEVLVKDGGALHLYRVDRGVIRSKANGVARRCASATAASSTIAVAPDATITIRGRPPRIPLCGKGMAATVIRDGDAPANEVRAGQG